MPVGVDGNQAQIITQNPSLSGNQQIQKSVRDCSWKSAHYEVNFH